MAGRPGLVGEPAGDQAEDPDRPRPVDEERGGVRTAGDADPRLGGRRGGPSHACWPGASPGSGSPNAARASAIAARIRSLRVALASSRIDGERRRLLRRRGEQEPRGVHRLPHPPGGVEPRREHEPDGLEVDRRRSACPPARAAPRSRAAAPWRIRSRPSRAIARFSPTIGATSETVPIVARSARSRASASAPASSPSSSRATVNATPDPDRPRVRVGRVRALRVDDGDRGRAARRAGDGGR